MLNCRCQQAVFRDDDVLAHAALIPTFTAEIVSETSLEGAIVAGRNAPVTRFCLCFERVHRRSDRQDFQQPALGRLITAPD